MSRRRPRHTTDVDPSLPPSADAPPSEAAPDSELEADSGPDGPGDSAPVSDPGPEAEAIAADTEIATVETLPAPPELDSEPSDPPESIETEFESLGPDQKRWLRSLMTSGAREIERMHPSEIDAAEAGLTEAETHYRERGLARVADVLAEMAAKVRLRKAPPPPPDAVPAPACWRVTKTSVYALNGSVHTLAEGSVVSDATHVMAELRAQGVVMEPCGAPHATPFNPVLEQRRGVIVATRFDLAFEEPVE